MRLIKHFLGFSFLCMFLASCIFVKDIGAYWEKGVIDPALAGYWVNADESHDCSSFVLAGKSYRVIDNGKKDESLYRTLQLGDNKFLMVRDPNNKYLLIKYTVSDENFTTYMPDEAKKDDFLRDYPDSGIIIGSGQFVTATIPLLDEKSIEMLQKIADDESYWKPASVQSRTKKCKV